MATVATIAIIRALAQRKAVKFSHEAISFHARGLSVNDVLHALAHAGACQAVGPDVVVVGPTLDGVTLRVVTRISDVIYVCAWDFA